MNKVGKIVHVSLGTINMATALVPRAQDEKDTLVLGQYVMLGREKADRMILGRIVEITPDFGDAGANYKDAVRDAMVSKSEIDNHYKAQLGHLIYKCKLLGVCHIKGKNLEFFSDVRHFPALDQLDVYVPSAEVMTSLMRSAVTSKSENDVIEFHIGDLAYGSDPSNTTLYQGENAVPVYFNVKNLLRRRTAIFGKSGYGKSNNVKSVVGMLARSTKDVGQLLIDTNGEYSLDNSQNDGFLDIFHQAGMPDKVVMFTNRALPDTTMKKFEKNIRPLKIDAYTEPATVFAMVAESVRRQIKNDELPKYLVKWVNGAETDDNKNAWDGSTQKGAIRSMYYAALFNEGIRPANKKQKCEVGTFIELEYIKKLLASDQELPEDQGTAEFVIQESDKNDLIDSHSITQIKGRYFTNSIETMAAYGKWFAEVAAENDTELRDYRDLVISKSYRLSSIKKLQIGSGGDNSGMSLSSSVFRSLKEGKIVILDLAMESIRVADVLTRHILNHIFTRMMEDFGRPEIRKEFNKRDIVVYIEEAQNFLSEKNISEGSIYERIVKEGRKFHIGAVYVTQQPSAISNSITSQTENIFALHLSNEKDTQVLHNIKDKFDELTCRFLKDEAAQGLAYIFSEPYQPFVVSCQLKLFSKDLIKG